ncbi:glycosyltransferase family 2 protein [Psychrobacter piscatorii]|uniref:glycosyltransferase family 2 protein n=1 Tax=Psychrobacter piscatorii TaxID=554343 RepID=UPI00191868A8|nr:glycosyltransferase family 2 protein [Psychrobacter piscatorii]
MKFTIFTPTYNRAHILKRLYESLESQTMIDFEWLIVDDGSVDSTKEYVRKIQSKSSFRIEYIYQDNLGKQAAYNTGIVNAKSKFFICVDSDDQIKNKCLEILDKTWCLLDDNEKKYCAGIVFLDCDLEGKLIGTKLPLIKFSNMYDLYHKHSVVGDKGIMFQTRILKDYKFPIENGESFITEAVLYNRISRIYSFYCLNNILEIRDYQKDGLSSKYEQLILENPLGNSIYFNELNFYEERFIQRIKNDAVSIKLKLLGKVPVLNIYRKSLNKKHFLFGFVLGVLMYTKAKLRKFAQNFRLGVVNDT